MTTRKEQITKSMRDGTYRIRTDAEIRKAGITDGNGKELPEGPEKEGLFALLSRERIKEVEKLAAANGDPDVYLANSAPDWLAVDVDENWVPIK